VKLFSAHTLLACLLTTAALAQPGRAEKTGTQNANAQNARVQNSHTTENLRGASAVSQQIAWASGTHGTYLRTTDAGHTWLSAQVPGAESLDFRAVVAFSADEAFLMSAGPGDQSRIYHTSDAGRRWQLQFTNTNAKGFFDSMVFWDPAHGVVLGDPIPDETGQLKFELLLTNDGQTWIPIPPAQLPPAVAGEGAFAASNSCLAVLSPNNGTAGELPVNAGTNGQDTTSSRAEIGSEKNRALAPEGNDPNLWFATGGSVARVFRSPDRGLSWQVFTTPILHGPDSAGIFSIAFRDSLHGVIAGGDYKHPDHDGPNLAFTSDGGITWTLSPIRPQAYFSAVAFDRNPPVPSHQDPAHFRLFIVAPGFIFDFRPPYNPSRINPRKKSGIKFNAISPNPIGGVLVVGPNGSIASLPALPRTPLH
jgi:photosystem II stability/assembly factor-like uncharacterized protein